MILYFLIRGTVEIPSSSMGTRVHALYSALPTVNTFPLPSKSNWVCPSRKRFMLH